MAGAGVFDHHLPAQAYLSQPRPTLSDSKMMDAGSDFIVQSPMGMAQQDHLPSPLGHDGARRPLPPDIDVNNSPNSKMRRKSVKVGSSTNAVKRSASTPNVRGMSTASDPAMSLAEKRRNKLGYHRTSVACVHCRRRKIRCLLAPDDPQKRCSNCIRLKKECNFFPVDQQPPADRRPRAGSKQEGAAGDTSTSSSSSPNMPTPHAGDHNEQFSYAQMPMSARSFSTNPLSLNMTAMSPPGSAAPLTTRFDIDHPGSGWDARFFDGNSIPTGHAIPEEHQNGYWKVPEAPMTPSFSPYNTSGPPSSLFHPSNLPSYSPISSRHENGWPARSMSYGHIEDPHHRHDTFPPSYPHDARRSTLDSMPPPSHTPSLHHSSATSSTASIADSSVASMSGPPATQPMMHYNQPPGWSPVTTQSPKTVDFGNWYQEPSQLTKVQEEDVAHYSEHPPAVMFASTGSH